MQRVTHGQGSVLVEPVAAGCATQSVLSATPAVVDEDANHAGINLTEAGTTVEGEGRGEEIKIRQSSLRLLVDGTRV